MTTTATCEFCRFWLLMFPDQEIGECRRHAPPAYHRAPSETLRDAAWPLTCSEEWCGEFVLAASHQPGSRVHAPELGKRIPLT